MSQFKTRAGGALLALCALAGCGRVEQGVETLRQSVQSAQSGPDFTITAVAGPASVQSGQRLSVQVTVCNQGTVGDGTDVELYLSADANIHANTKSAPSEDRLLGAAYLSLGPGQCTTLPLSGTAALPSGSNPNTDTAFYLGAVVDPRNDRPESNEDNNITSYRIGVGNRPDFTVTAVVGPVSVQSGQPLTARVTVCNQGTVSDGADVELYLSADTTIRASTSPAPSEDRLLGSASVPALEPGQCFTVPVSGPAALPSGSNPNTDTAFYLGAVVDPRNLRSELLEDNNTLAGSRIGVGSRPDFLVTSVTGPGSVQSGQPFTAQVKVCNQGTVGESTNVELYLSADAIIRANTSSGPPEDSFMGASSIPLLPPGECATVSIPGQGTSPAGGNAVYFVGAVVDPRNDRLELFEDNNTLAGYRMGVGNRPDFLVTSVTGPASVRNGQSFTAQVTVCNQGTSSDNTEVELYLSADATIRASTSSAPSEDRLLGSAYVPSLSLGQCITVPIFGSAALPAGSNPNTDTAFYLGAVVDPRNTRFELIEDNNTLAGYRIGVGNRSDFIVTTVTGPASVQNGQPLTAQVTVCNQGMGGESTMVELYLSADTTLRARVPPASSSEDRLLGSAYVPMLSPGQCTTVPISGTAALPVGSSPSTDTAFYLGAVVDPANANSEFFEDNNTTSYRISVGSRPDFLITSVTGPASIQGGQPLTARVTVCNQGTVSDGADVELYLSADATIRASSSSAPSEDRLLGSASVPALEPGQCFTVPVSGPAALPSGGNPSTDTAFYLGAVVDPRNLRSEFLEDNNTLVGNRIGVGSRPDFLVTSVTGPGSVQSGQPFTAQVKVCNQGTVSDFTKVELYLSDDAIIRTNASAGSPADFFMGASDVPPLFPGECATVSIPGRLYSGVYFVGAVVDPRNERLELIEDNNTLAGYRMGIGSLPDYVITSVTGPASVQMSQPFTVQATVCNQGTAGTSSNTDLVFLLSEDALLHAPTPSAPTEDGLLGSTSIPPLAPGACTGVSINGQASWNTVADKPYYLGAVIDPSNSFYEFFEDNNATVGYRIGLGRLPDFRITALTGPTPANVQPGQPVTVQVTVCNQGTVGASTDVELYLSADTTLRASTSSGSSEDRPLGLASVPPLEPGQCTTLPVSGPAALPMGSNSNLDTVFYLGAVVDPRNMRPEFLEDNNAFVGNRIGVGSRPDFLVTAVTGPASVRASEFFTAQVTVCNQGTVSEGADVELYLSADTTLRPNTPSTYSEDYLVSGVTVPPLAPGGCTTLSLSGSASYYSIDANRAAYLGAVVDPRNSRPELFEDNNITVGERMGVGDRPDFLVTSVTGPASVLPGQTISAQATVCNRGTVGDSTAVELYLSADDNLHANTRAGPSEDLLLAGVPSLPLGPGQCAPVALSGTAPSASGPNARTVYFLGTVVDPLNDRAEFIEDNNVTVGYRIGVGSLPDFRVTAVTGPTSVQNGQPLTAQVTVCNQGTVGEGASEVELYLSADATIRANTASAPSEDRLLGSASVPPLGAGQCTPLALSGTVALPAGSDPNTDTVFSLGAVVDPRNTRVEFLEDNNATVGYRIGVGSRPDLRVTAVTGPAVAQNGQPFTAQVTVCNQGTVGASSDVELYLSADAVIRTSTSSGPSEDSLVGMASVPPLAPGQCITLAVSSQAMPPARDPSAVDLGFYLGAVVDPRNTRIEFFEDNNTYTGYRMGVGSEADFVVSAVSGPASAPVGQDATFQVTVCNQGMVAADTSLALLLLAGETIAPTEGGAPPVDRVVSSGYTPILAPGECWPATLRGWVAPPPGSTSRTGSFRLGALVNPNRQRTELLRDNNGRVGDRITLY